MIKGLAEKLKESRIKCNYTQWAVAKKLEVSPSIISGYETGERTPSAEMLLALSRLYRCSTDYLLGREAVEPSATLNVDGLSTNQIAALTELIRTIRE